MLRVRFSWLEIVLLMEQTLEIAWFILQLLEVDNLVAEVASAFNRTMLILLIFGDCFLSIWTIKDFLKMWERLEKLWVLLELRLDEVTI